MHLNELTELLTLEVGTETEDEQGGRSLSWEEGDPLWARVRQRLSADPSAGEGGQSIYAVTYELCFDGAISLPNRIRILWQGQYLYPLHRPIVQQGGLWQILTVKEDAHDRL